MLFDHFGLITFKNRDFKHSIADSKFLICIGKDCVTFDTETWEVATFASLNDYHYEGKMFLDPKYKKNIVIGGTHGLTTAKAAERYNSEMGQWEFVFTPEDKSFPIDYRRFSIASGFASENPNSYLFSGFAFDSGSTFLPDLGYCFNSDINEVTEIDPPHALYPISDIGLIHNFQPKRFDSIGGGGYLLHHRTQECTNSSMR